MEQAIMQEQLMLPATYTTSMTPETARRIEALKATIDVHDRAKVIALGREEQASIGQFSDSILKGIGSNEFGEAGDLLTKVVEEINGYHEEVNGKAGGLFGFLKKQKSKLQTLQTKYRSLADNMDIVVRDLQRKDFALGQVSSNLDVMYAENQKLYEFLTMIICAGEMLLAEERQKETQIQLKAQMSGNPMENQSASDFSREISRFEKRLYDLKMSRAIAIQQAPQIRLIQGNAEEISESIKKTITTTIPLWKTQMAMALGMQTVKEGLQAVGRVKSATTNLLLENSQRSKQLILEAARAAEKGAVDIETINQINSDLVEALTSSCDITRRAVKQQTEEANKLQENEATLKDAIASYTELN